MTTKNKIFLSSGIAILVVIIAGIGYYINNNTTKMISSEAESGIIENTWTTNNFLTDDNVTGLTWCTDKKILNEFSKYTLVKKISRDWYTYDIYAYDTKLDLNEIMNKIDIIGQKGINEKIKRDQLDQIISGYRSEYRKTDIETGVIRFMDSDSIDNSLEESYRIVDVIYSRENNNWENECYLESENGEPHDININKVDKALIKNLNKFLWSIISGNLDISYLPSLWREKENDEYVFTNKPYKNGVLEILWGEGWIHISYIKSVGNKIYTFSSKSLELKDLKSCNNNDSSCEKATNTYIKNLFNGTETLAEYTQVRDEFLTKIDEIFEN